MEVTACKKSVSFALLNILSQYNFTVDESDPSEQELAVDPEMLGKIFEKLLDVKDGNCR